MNESDTQVEYIDQKLKEAEEDIEVGRVYKGDLGKLLIKFSRQSQETQGFLG